MPVNLFSEDVAKAISIVENSTMAFSHFIAKWEVRSKAHAFYIPPYAWNMFFDQKGGQEKLQTKIDIRWQDDVIFNNSIYYYSSKREYRVADFGGNSFEFLQEKYIGSLLIMAKIPDMPYEAYVLEKEKDIADFLDYYRQDDTQRVHCLKGLHNSRYNKAKADGIEGIANSYEDFPTTLELCSAAQDLIISLKKYKENQIVPNCDKLLLDWYDADFRIFSLIEERLYQPFIIEPIGDLNKLLRISKVISNRRKSRAGLSLENHLSRIFDAGGFEYEKHAETELKKKPDFLFPSSYCYKNPSFNKDKLIMLGAKTTCKDRWRQVLNEADRIEHKFLFTLQQGVSKDQLKEMASCNLTLIVPKSNLGLFDYSETKNVFDLGTFVSYVKEKQS